MSRREIPARCLVTCDACRQVCRDEEMAPTGPSRAVGGGLALYRFTTQRECLELCDRCEQRLIRAINAELDAIRYPITPDGARAARENGEA